MRCAVNVDFNLIPRFGNQLAKCWHHSPPAPSRRPSSSSRLVPGHAAYQHTARREPRAARAAASSLQRVTSRRLCGSTATAAVAGARPSPRRLTTAAASLTPSRTGATRGASARSTTRWRAASQSTRRRPRPRARALRAPSCAPRASRAASSAATRSCTRAAPSSASSCRRTRAPGPTSSAAPLLRDARWLGPSGGRAVTTTRHPAHRTTIMSRWRERRCRHASCC